MHIGLWVGMTNLTFFSRPLKGDCYGNPFCREAAKINGIPNFVLCTDILQRMGDRNTDARINTADDV